MTETGLWRLSLIPADATLGTAIRSLDRSALQIALVVDTEGRLLGTLTDGDIRRGLLRGLGIDSPLGDVVRRDPLVVPPTWGRDMVLPLMQANRIHQIPVVDEDRRVVGLHVLDQLLAPQPRGNVMVIMAGGRGSRLGSATDSCPKPLLPVGGRPMIEHIVVRAASEGFHSFVLAVHYLGHKIEEYFGDGSRLGVEISYVKETTPLGTAGALALLEPRPDAPFVVTNGDVLADIHYGEVLEFHARQGAAATMAVRPYEWRHPFGVVMTDGLQIVGFAEKPVTRTHINAGIYVLEPRTIENLTAGEPCDMPALFDRLRECGERTIVYPMHEPWLDVGRPADLEQARASLSDAGKVS